jgi:hypothetical protein
MFHNINTTGQCLKLSSSSWPNKLVFVSGKSLKPSLIFAGKGRSLPNSVILISIGIEWTGLPETITLAYLDVTKKKACIVNTWGQCEKILFFATYK